MRPIRPLHAVRARRGAGSRAARRRSTPLSALALCAALALTATACNGDDGGDAADKNPSASAEDGITIPDGVKDRLKEHGIDLDDWKGGAWKNWNKDDWLREAEDFVNPIIDDLWDEDRMRDADKQPAKPVEDDISGDQGKTDPTPAPVEAAALGTPYTESSPATGKLFFDGPEGSMVCSATVVTDPANPGKSNMVWTAGHCVHAGKEGGWYRNIMFVPSYNNQGKSAAEIEGAPREEMAPHDLYWADWAQTSQQWIETGGPTGGAGAPFDFAVLHVKPEKDNGKSLEETVGGALPVEFSAPAVSSIDSMTATGYPAAPPYDGQRQLACADKPGRLSLNAEDPTMYRIGCTMTGGSSGGGWVAKGKNGKPALVSNTSIGPVTAGWLAGPRLGDEAKGIYEAVSEKYAG
ncbi:trypsin-like serine peptidase [Streptomyces sp. NPDC050418]|uniref:trypsin-like serine peptidase n=1 Tax=Streptomyces sp. NPDC050418 TaxID=3365612 RepID=UPI0037BB0AEB